jgi:hypothetical protein
MTTDERLAALLTECLKELSADTPAGDVRAVDALREIEATAPGELRQMADRLRLARPPRTTVH